MEKSKVAIIVPVYNVEKYIKECLTSIKEQTYKNFVAIVVNDGSQDNSVSIIEDTIKDDERFIFLHKENGGLSSARNYGLKYIEDNRLDIDYVAYVDSDDLITEDFVEVFVQKISENKADIAFCFYKELYKSRVNVLSNDIQDNVLIYSQNEIIPLYLKEKNYPKGYESINNFFLCNKFFNYKKFKDILFNEKKGIIGEDINYMLNILTVVEKAIIIPKNLVIYRLRKSSLSHNKKVNVFYQLFEMYIDNYKKFSGINSIDIYINREILQVFFHVINCFLILNKKQEAYNFWDKYISIIREIELDSKTRFKIRKKKFLAKLSFESYCFYFFLRKIIKKSSNANINYHDFFD